MHFLLWGMIHLWTTPMEAVEQMREETPLECKRQVHLEKLTLQTANCGPGEGL